MPTMNISIQHSLPKEEALSRMKQFTEEMKSKYAGQVQVLRDEWQGNSGAFSLKIMGFALSGEMEVTEAAVNFSVKYPLFASSFKSRVEEKVRETVQTLIE